LCQGIDLIVVLTEWKAQKLGFKLNRPWLVLFDQDALLAGCIFDDCGNRMTPSHARKRGVKYRYCISAVLVQGQQGQAGTVSRVSAPEIEAEVLKAVRMQVGEFAATKDDLVLIQDHVARVDIRPDRLVVELVHAPDASTKRKSRRQQIEVPWRKASSTRRREILRHKSAASQPVRPIRSENRALLITSIARGRRWLNEIVANSGVTAETIAARENCSPRKVNMTISLAFLAPSLVQAAIEGRLPHGMGVTRLCDLPPEWPRQHQILGLFPALLAIFEPVSVEPRLCFPGNGNFRPETGGQNWPRGVDTPLQRRTCI
jgi:hypothetical protein